MLHHHETGFSSAGSSGLAIFMAVVFGGFVPAASTTGGGRRCAELLNCRSLALRGLADKKMERGRPQNSATVSKRLRGARCTP